MKCHQQLFLGNPVLRWTDYQTDKVINITFLVESKKKTAIRSDAYCAATL